MDELGVREVTLIGGEAYLRDDWVDIAAEITRRGMRCSMTTGGRGLTADRAALAKRAGLSGVSVSIDGLAETHDRLRGVPGSHAAAFAALGHLREAGFPLLVNTQINRLSMPELPALFERLVSEGVRHWQIQVTVPMGRAADEPEVLLQPYDYLALFPMLADLKQRGLEHGLLMQPGNNVGYFGPYEKILRSHLKCNYATGCGAGRVTLGIEADGTIKGCPSLPTAAWAGGNIRDASLEDIWERAEPLRYTRDRTVDDLWGYCRECYYAETCMAGCTWTGHVFFDRPGNNPYCHHRALEMQRRGKRERLVRADEAKGRPFDNGRFELIVEDIETGDRPEERQQ
jgi:radical SAM protein with 4Fe4S-binding SPASM domain